MRKAGSRSWVVGLLALAAIAGLAANAQAASGLALLAIAAIPAIFAVPPRGRVALGVVVGGCGLVVLLLGEVAGDPAALVSLAALGAAGVIIGLRGMTWPQLARRYDDRATDAPVVEPVDLWRALDRGEDPTATDPSAAGGQRPPPNSDRLD